MRSSASGGQVATCSRSMPACRSSAMTDANPVFTLNSRTPLARCSRVTNSMILVEVRIGDQRRSSESSRAHEAAEQLARPAAPSSLAQDQVVAAPSRPRPWPRYGATSARARADRISVGDSAVGSAPITQRPEIDVRSPSAQLSAVPVNTAQGATSPQPTRPASRRDQLQRPRPASNALDVADAVPAASSSKRPAHEMDGEPGDADVDRIGALMATSIRSPGAWHGG